jgi:hypothetical protein
MYERHKKPDVETEEDKFDYKMTPALMRKLKSGIVSPMAAYGRKRKRRRTKSTQGSGGTETATQTAAKKAPKRGKK